MRKKLLQEWGLLQGYRSDRIRYKKWNYCNGNVQTKNAFEAKILRQAHILEKGMSVSAPKPHFGVEKAEALLDQIDAFKAKISVGDLPYQIKKLEFEKKWVADKNKFPTSPEMVKMLEKELESVKAQYEIQLAVDAAKPLLEYKSKSKPLKALQNELNEAINGGKTATEIRTLTDKVKAKIHELEKARLSKLAKQGDGSTIDLYATAEEKLEVARLQDAYDKALAQYGSQWNSNVGYAYKRLAEYKKELAKKALDEYVNAPVNHSGNNAIGGRWQNYSSEEDKMRAYSKKTGISVDELALINRYTYGSKWCNNYGYGIVDPYFGKVEDYGGLCQKYYPAHNAALEKMPRYNGTVFSGISFDSMKLEKYIKEMQQCLSSGTPYVNKAFMSTTTSIENTAIFGDNLMLVIKSKKGADVKAISHYPNEDEVVFRAGSRFKVIKVYQETERKFGFGRGWVVELEEI